MIDNSITSALGVGSGIDTNSLVKQLTQVEGAAQQNRINSTRKETEAKISDFGLLKSALSSLQTSLKNLSSPEGLYSKSASFNADEFISPEKLDTASEPGTYSIQVLQTAQAQSLASGTYTDPSAAVGTGELTLQFGEWNGDGFTLNGTTESATITIDDSNNTLRGLRDAINDADIGAQASIINDGEGYRLVVTAPSGAKNEIQIQATEGAEPGLANFAYTGSTSPMTEAQGGKDALLTVNGVNISRSTNFIDDVVDGFSFNAVKPSDGVATTVTISEDKSYAEETIRGFVSAYNNFFRQVDSAFRYGEQKEEGGKSVGTGSLASDSLAKSVLSQLRSAVSANVAGVDGEGFNALTNLGIRTELNGSLSIDEDEFGRAMDENFHLVQELFTETTSSTSSALEVSGFQDRTVAGAYDINITQNPAKGSYTAGNSVDLSAGLDASGKDYSFDITINGTTSGTLSLPQQTYGSAQELASALQSAINADEALKARDDSVTVSYDGSKFTFTSNEYGTSSVVDFANVSAAFAADFGIGTGSGSLTGQNVAGTINGVAATGTGSLLMGAADTAASGLNIRVSENAVSGTVNVSRGFAGELSKLIDRFQNDEGVIANRTSTLEDRLKGLADDQEKLDRRLSAFQERMMQQFISMENIINSLNSSGGYLDNLMKTLPFTADKG